MKVNVRIKKKKKKKDFLRLWLCLAHLSLDRCAFEYIKIKTVNDVKIMKEYFIQRVVKATTLQRSHGAV